MLKIIKSITKNDHVQSFFRTLITDLLYDAAIAGATTQIVTGDLSKAALLALGYAIFRTAARVFLSQMKELWPKPEESKGQA